MYFGQYLDEMDKITVGEVWRLQRSNPEGFAWIYDDTDAEGCDPWSCRIAVFSIEKITGGRGRFYQCDGKLTVDDIEFGAQEFPLVWRQSNLNRSGFWVLVGVNCYGRTLYRTRNGWELAAHIRQNDRHGALYEEQKKSKKRREGRGLVGEFERAVAVACFADNWNNEARDRKLTYRGRPTPFLRYTVKQFRKLKIPLPPGVEKLLE